MVLFIYVCYLFSFLLYFKLLFYCLLLFFFHFFLHLYLKYIKPYCYFIYLYILLYFTVIIDYFFPRFFNLFSICCLKDILKEQKYLLEKHRKFGMPDQWKSVCTLPVSDVLRFSDFQLFHNQDLSGFSLLPVS